MDLLKDDGHELPSPHFSFHPPGDHLEEILSALSDDDISFEELAALIDKRPLISAVIIRDANSASVGTGRQIRSVRHAIALLGLERIRALMMEIRTDAHLAWNRANASLDGSNQQFS